jgi:hypothetical protein
MIQDEQRPKQRAVHGFTVSSRHLLSVSFTAETGGQAPYHKYSLMALCGTKREDRNWSAVISAIRESPSYLNVRIKAVNLHYIHIKIFAKDERLTVVFQENEDSTSSFSLVKGRNPDDLLRCVQAQEILDLCNEKYGLTVPRLPNMIHVGIDKDCLEIAGRIDDALLSALQGAQTVFKGFPSTPRIIPATALTLEQSPATYLTPNTSLISFGDRKFIYKSSIYPSRVPFDYAEMSNLLRLPKAHRSIPAGLGAVVTISASDERICGFLMPFYAKGNLDV